MAHDDSVRERACRVVPRAPFLPADQRHRAGRDAPLPIGHGQTNSQPFTVGAMLRLLDVKPGSRVLDLGSGSGWTTALLAHLVGPEGAVIGVERQEALIEPSRRVSPPRTTRPGRRSGSHARACSGHRRMPRSIASWSPPKRARCLLRCSSSWPTAG